MEEQKKLSVFQLLKSGTSLRRERTPNNRKEQQQQNKENVELKNKFYESDSESNHIDFDLNRTYKKDQNIKVKNKKINKIQQLLSINNIKIDIKNPVIISNFSKLMSRYDFNKQILMNIKQLGYRRLQPIQMSAIPQILSEKNLLALAPTGSGKTLAFALPLLHQLSCHTKGLRCIIFAPTQELSEQIFRQLLVLNNETNNGLIIKNINNMTTNYQQFNKDIQNVDVLVSTPLKFIKSIKYSKSILDKVRHVVFDEIDRYFELSLDNQVNQIFQLLNIQKEEEFEEINKDYYSLFQKEIQFLLFSATVTHKVQQLANKVKNLVTIQIGNKNNTINHIKQKLIYCQTEVGKLDFLKELINEGQFTPPVLIFVQSKDRAKQLYETLTNSMKFLDLRLGLVHNNIESKERENIILQYRQGKIWALICTDLIARGIDFPNIKLVINYDFPNSIVNYIHRVGRTGRGESKEGLALTFYTNQDKVYLKQIGNLLKYSGCEIEDWILELNDISRDSKIRLEKFPMKREDIQIKQYKLQKDSKDNAYFKNFKKAILKRKKEMEMDTEEFENEEDNQ